MIAKATLRELITRRIKDADALIMGKRYEAAVYMAGYALELALKKKICRTFGLSSGFPENRAEFLVYRSGAAGHRLLAAGIGQIMDIRNHDLNALLVYSGAEYRIKLHFLPEWTAAASWSPELRYEVRKVLKAEAVKMVNAVKTLVQTIF